MRCHLMKRGQLRGPKLARCLESSLLFPVSEDFCSRPQAGLGCRWRNALQPASDLLWSNDKRHVDGSLSLHFARYRWHLLLL